MRGHGLLEELEVVIRGHQGLLLYLLGNVSLYERGIKNGLGEHDVAAIIEVINGIADEKSLGKSRAAAR
jgi:hypothetical protein